MEKIKLQIIGTEIVKEFDKEHALSILKHEGAMKGKKSWKRVSSKTKKDDSNAGPDKGKDTTAEKRGDSGSSEG